MRRIILILFTCSLLLGTYIERALGQYGFGFLQPQFPLGIQIDWITINYGRIPYINAPNSLISISPGGSVLNESGEILRIEKVYGYSYAKESDNIYVEVATKNKEVIHYVSFYKNKHGVTESIATPKLKFEQKLHKNISEHEWVSLEIDDIIDSMLGVARLINFAFLFIMFIVLLLYKRKGNKNA